MSDQLRNQPCWITLAPHFITMGRHIIFEGLDGAGKTTLMNRVEEWLQETGRTVWTTKTPSYFPTGNVIRSYFGQAFPWTMGEDHLFMGSLFAADLMQHDLEVREKLREEPGDDLVILQSRSWFSTYCYHYGSPGIQKLLVNEVRPKLSKPDAVLFLHAPVDICLERIRARDQAIVDAYETRGRLQAVKDQWLQLKRFLLSTHTLDLDTDKLGVAECMETVQKSLTDWGIVHGD